MKKTNLIDKHNWEFEFKQTLTSQVVLRHVKIKRSRQRDSIVYVTVLGTPTKGAYIFSKIKRTIYSKLMKLFVYSLSYIILKKDSNIYYITS